MPCTAQKRFSFWISAWHTCSRQQSTELTKKWAKTLQKQCAEIDFLVESISCNYLQRHCGSTTAPSVNGKSVKLAFELFHWIFCMISHCLWSIYIRLCSFHFSDTNMTTFKWIRIFIIWIDSLSRSQMALLKSNIAFETNWRQQKWRGKQFTYINQVQTYLLEGFKSILKHTTWYTNLVCYTPIEEFLNWCAPNEEFLNWCAPNEEFLIWCVLRI